MTGSQLAESYDPAGRPPRRPVPVLRAGALRASVNVRGPLGLELRW
ncbi:hypothetical protein [Phytohabitans houttuyneae]|nr:hypothetical protein [Phytohabitans houttuyneae]